MSKEERENWGKHSFDESKKSKSKNSKEHLLNSKIEVNRPKKLNSNRNTNQKYQKKGSTSKNKKKNKKKKKMNKVLKGILIFLITVLVVFCALFGTYLYKAGGNFKQAFMNMMKTVVGDQDPIFVLVLGVSEDISAELTDTIMLIGYNPDNNQAFVLSIPRDTFIGSNESKAGGFDKINALYQKDPQRTVDAVEKITGIKIDHYVTVKTSVLVSIVNTLGGVDFDVPIDMDYDDSSQDLHIHLKAGPQKLNGDQAEQLVRFRHNNNGSSYSGEYGDNDEGRTRTQREFLKVVAGQVKQTKNVDQLKQIVSSIFDNLETNITLNKVLGYIPYAVDIDLNEMQMAQLPGDTGKLNGLWFFKVDKEATKEMINEYVDKLGLSDYEKKQYLIESEKKTTTKTTNSSNKSTSEKSSTNTTNTNKAKNSVNTTKNTVTNSTNTTNKNNTSKGNTTSNTQKNQVNTTNKTNSSVEQHSSNTVNKVEEKNDTNNSKNESNNVVDSKPSENETNTNVTGSTGGSNKVESNENLNSSNDEEDLD